MVKKKLLQKIALRCYRYFNVLYFSHLANTPRECSNNWVARSWESSKLLAHVNIISWMFFSLFSDRIHQICSADEIFAAFHVDEREKKTKQNWSKWMCLHIPILIKWICVFSRDADSAGALCSASVFFFQVYSLHLMCDRFGPFRLIDMWTPFGNVEIIRVSKYNKAP